MTTIYHGSKQIVEYPEIRITGFNKDFYYGFYYTLLKTKAMRWAVRLTRSGIINEYNYTPNDEPHVLKFETMTEEWLDFIAQCRLAKPHDFDIVEGPMANDTIFNYVQSFVDGEISRAAFWELAKFKHPTYQMSFHTACALTTLKFIRGYEVHA